MEIINTLPVFENSQVLTASQLNSMRDYLQQQNNITRVGLIGRGIVCGLEATKIGNTYKISAGIGVSSWGFLFCVDDCELTHFKEYKIPDNTDYFPFQDDTGKQNTPLWELLPSSANGNTGVSSLSDFDGNLNEYVVLLYMEEYNKDLQSCLGKSCDELGIDRTYTIRKLLIKKTDLDLVNAETNNKGGYLYEGLFDAKELHLMQPILNAQTSSNYHMLVIAYLTPVAIITKPLFENLDIIYQAIYPILKNKFPNSPISDLYNLWNDTLIQYTEKFMSGEAIGFQYLYDRAADAVKSLNELACAAMHLNSQCKFNSNAFPMHLMLGKISCPPDKYRQEFVYSPLFNEQKDWTQKVVKLFTRTAEIIANFIGQDDSLGKEFGIAATPSMEKWQNLGKSSIPFYYKPETMDENWDENKCGVCYTKGNSILSYYKQKEGGSNIGFETTPWYFNTQKYNFIRIEGQQGFEVGLAIEKLKGIAKRFNIPFSSSYAFLGQSTPKGKYGDNDCCYPDLDVKYLPWRNKFLFYVRNILNTTKQLETVFENFSTAFGSTQKANSYYYAPEAAAAAPNASDGNVVMEKAAYNNSDSGMLKGFDKVMFNMAAFQENFELASAKNVNISPKNKSKIIKSKVSASTAGSKASTDSPLETLLGWITDFNDCLEGMEKVLPTSFCRYDHTAFTEQYKCTMNKWIALIKLFRDMINRQRDPAMVQNLVNLVLLYKGIAFFKDVLFIDIDTIAEMKARRLQQVEKTKIFSNVVRKNPGIEHLAGVYRNDQLVLLTYTPPLKETKKDIDVSLLEMLKKSADKNETTEKFVDIVLQYIKEFDSKNLSKLEGRVIADFAIHNDYCCECEADVDSYSELAPQAFPKAYAINLEQGKEVFSTIFKPVNVFYHPERYHIAVNSRANYSEAEVITQDYQPIDGLEREIVKYTVSQEDLNKSPNNRTKLILFDEIEYEIQDRENDFEVLDSGIINVFLYRNKVAELPTFSANGRLVSDKKDPITFYAISLQDAKTGDNISETTIQSAQGIFTIPDLEPGDYTVSFSVPGFNNMDVPLSIKDQDEDMGDIVFRRG
ncbi:MAG: carboxypeptidase regulatory-like domain-containing protein [Bacteroidia bacterium]|nr:carboxypeptidase regulatory-like domain-containing protein [Bacteroidia bacterium]